MAGEYKPKKGDRVRVVLEGDVESVTPGYGIYLNDTQYRSFARDEHVVSVEKIEPPVEVFQPGDVVRSFGGSLYALTEGGYVDLKGGKVWNDGRSWCENTFTSRYYEKVSLG